MHTEPTDVALVHDYLTQLGGGERVALTLAELYPDAPLYTSVYAPATTFAEFGRFDVRPSSLNRFELLRKHPRVGLPLYASTFERTVIDAEVTICSSSGWAHGVSTTGSKLVYCHTPARWVYHRKDYLGIGKEQGLSPVQMAKYLAASVAVWPLRHWDQRAASSATSYLANSTATQRLIKEIYGIDATVVNPPALISTADPREPTEGLEPGYLLCVARLLPYKNVDVVVDAARKLGRRLVVVGKGPELEALQQRGHGTVTFTGTVSEARLRWLYANAGLHIAMSHEDFGLTPIEAAIFGKPTIALGSGGYLDTVVAGVSGIFVSDATCDDLADAIIEAEGTHFDPVAITNHAATFSRDAFDAAIRNAVDQLRR